MCVLYFCRPYIVNLLPCIARICRREEEAVQETLSAAMPKICSALMPFANDTEVKVSVNKKILNIVTEVNSLKNKAVLHDFSCQF